MAKAIPSITIPEFKTAKALIGEYQAAEGLTQLQAKARAQLALHKAQPKFFQGLFDGIWKALADHFATITQLNNKGSAIQINKTKYATSTKPTQGGQLITLTQSNNDASMPKLLNFETELGADSPLQKSKVNSLQIQDTENPKGDRATYWIEQKVITSTDSAGNRYRVEKPLKVSLEDDAEVPIEGLRPTRTRKIKRDQTPDEINLGLQQIDPKELEGLTTRGFESSNK